MRIVALAGEWLAHKLVIRGMVEYYSREKGLQLSTTDLLVDMQMQDI
jgi:hypothetical protein